MYVSLPQLLFRSPTVRPFVTVNLDATQRDESWCDSGKRDVWCACGVCVCASPIQQTQ